MDEQRLIRILERRQEITAKIKELQEVKNEYDQAVKDMLKERGKYTYGDYHVSWTETSSRRLDTKVVPEKYPEIAEECTTISVADRLTISKRKEKPGG